MLVEMIKVVIDDLTEELQHGLFVRQREAFAVILPRLLIPIIN